ncbi:NADAR family protein [Anaerovirgula multivorans]|nr:NADAR family protein [Anaerovirgula multivorans]
MKAKLFADEEIAQKILKVKSPIQQKVLGRKVRHFDQKIWESNCKKVVYDGNYAKFTQNTDLKQLLMKTKGTTLVEASPTDRIWGVGLAEEDSRILDRKTWKGKNWLGEILTQLRKDLLGVE